MSKTKTVEFQIKKNIGIIILKNEKKLNAWDYDMRSTIIKIFNKQKHNKKIKALVITGSGTKAFCSGQDLYEMSKFTYKDVIKWINQFKILYSCIRSFEKPIVGAINGVAAGSGFQLALLTDIRVSHKNAKFGQVEINSGVVSIIGPWIIEKVLGFSNCVELCLTGKLISGEEAKIKGIIHHFTNKKDVLKKSIKIAQRFVLKTDKCNDFNQKKIVANI
tara:strand:+ start:683 stop:1339 length:657 start_codon:yes stop_codon:yes gene_type:complete